MTVDEIQVNVHNPHWKNENKMKTKTENKKQKQYNRKKKKVTLILAKDLSFLFYE